MKANFEKILTRIKDVAHSKRGRDILIYCIFLVIATILWMVLSLNEETQHDIRMPVRITHVPDSVTIITTPPSNISVSLRAKGSQLFKQALGRTTPLNIDFRAFASRNSVMLRSSDIKGLIRSEFGGATVLVADPDSLNLVYTTRRGTPLPVKVDYKLTTGPQSIPAGRPTLSVDSVLVYSRSRLNGNIRSISTEPLIISDINQNTTVKARLIAPPNTRVIPDSIDVTFNVEPLIRKSRKVVIEPINVPAGIKLITFPAQTEVFYMVPSSMYNDSDPHFRVQADYNTISRSSRNIKLRLRDVPSEFHNVHLGTDSAEYYIERK